LKLSVRQVDNIIIIEVEEGRDKPYRCSKGFYVRNGASSQKMRRDEIRDFFTPEGKARFDESICKGFDYKKHFDSKKFRMFLKLAEITKVSDTSSLLINLGVAVKKGEKILPEYFSESLILLLFMVY